MLLWTGNVRGFGSNQKGEGSLGKQGPGPEVDDDQRPVSIAEKESFSSGGRRHWILLRGRWGLVLDRVFVWLTSYSLITKQYAVAQGHRYQPTLMLSTVGARSGRKRTACLPFFDVDGDWVVRGSNGGGATDPHWVHNIRANPSVSVRYRWRSRALKAHVAKGEERELLYEKLSGMSKTTVAYQMMCSPRELPLVVLRS